MIIKIHLTKDNTVGRKTLFGLKCNQFNYEKFSLTSLVSTVGTLPRVLLGTQENVLISFKKMNMIQVKLYLFYTNVVVNYNRERVREREHQSASGGGAERGNPKQAPGPELSAQSLIWGSNS